MPSMINSEGSKGLWRQHLECYLYNSVCAETPRVKNEFDQIIAELDREHARTGINSNVISWKVTRLSFVETFTVKANIRRVMQTCISYGLAQLSGANSVTSYFIPIMKLIGTAGDSHHSLFLSSM